MDGTIACGGCQHVKALHRATGGCRVNGCPCIAFSQLAEFPIELVVTPAPSQPSRVLSLAQKVAAAAIAFIAGLLVGQSL